MSDAYKRAIELIAADKFDARAVVIELAKELPQIFVAIVDGVTTADPYAQMNATLKPILEAGRKVEAIKECRSQTGWGLKEAKDYCDALQRGEKPIIPAALMPPPAPTKSLAELLDDLLGAEKAKTPATSGAGTW